MNKNQFIQYLKRPDLLDQSTAQELKEMIDNYPFFPVIRILYLCNLKNINSYKFEQELSKHAIFIPDRAALFRLVSFQTKHDEGFELLPYDEDTLKEFLEVTEKTEEHHTDEFDYMTTEVFRLIDSPVEPLPSENDIEPDLIEKFIQGGISIETKNEQPSEAVKILSEQSNHIAEEMITETLAKVYLRQGLYDEALKSYEKLILKFPEKNSYFAGQIENIKKLISKES
jgi:hypothetical protein